MTQLHSWLPPGTEQNTASEKKCELREDQEKSCLCM